jgi:hypothetical protein
MGTPYPTVIYITWTIEDVLQQAKEMKMKITKRQCGKVLDMVKHKHDANIGVNWNVIAYWIREVTGN